MFNWIKRHKKLSLLLIILVLGYYQTMVRTGLPDDEEMIEHFQLHRSEIEELVLRYRAFDFDINKGESHYSWTKQGNTPELLKKAGVSHISYISVGLWLDEPYSLETAKRVEEGLIANRGSGFKYFHQYSSLEINFIPRDLYYMPKLFHGVVWKNFVYFPQSPRMENGYLLGPVSVKGDQFKKRVMSSLNRIPLNWEVYECVYRQVEPQWFLRMCNGR